MQKMFLKFLEKTSEKQEFELFLESFKNLPKEQFAVIKISGQALENHLDSLASDIVFLNKLGIFPIVVHGAGSVLDKILPNSKKVNGLRITNKENLRTIKQVFDEVSTKLIIKIFEKGGNAKKILNVFECKQLQELGFVGEIKKVNVQGIIEAIANNSTPIISPLGFNAEIEFNINADTAAKELVKAIGSKKFILITETGGILDKNGKILPFLNVSEKSVFQNVSGGMLLKIKEIKEFLDSGINCAVVITSAENLLKEIFTIKGSGTFIKCHKIKTTKNLAQEEKQKLKELMEDSFCKKLAEDYFEEPIEQVFFEKNFEGAAIIKKLNGIAYLDKFAVGKQFQGTGLGKSLWEEINKKYSKIVWRAVIENHANKFYKEKCSGMMKKDKWIVYWKNLEENEILETVKRVSEKPETLIANKVY